MPKSNLAQRLLLPELKFVRWSTGEGPLVIEGRKTSNFEVCPTCARPCNRVYDRRVVTVRDEPIRGEPCCLRILKRRFRCECGKIFTESVLGIRKKARTTERFRAACIEGALQFESVSKAIAYFRCSSGYVYRSLYRFLARKTKEQQRTTFPAVVGLDEHSFRRERYKRTEFVTMVVAPCKRRRGVVEVVRGKSSGELLEGLKHFEGAEHVRTVVLDMSKAYRAFARTRFPNAMLVADKFHVIRLLGPVVLKYRKKVHAKRTDRATRKLLLADVKRLDYDLRRALGRFLERHPELLKVWMYYQRLMGFYRIRGQRRAATALTKITDDLAQENIPELKSFRRTLMQWRNEILAYFQHRITNARAEGFNNRAKVLQRKAYGFRSFENYRLRILSACA